MYNPPTIIRVGSQDIYDIGDRLRFVINELMPAKGYRGWFALREAVVKEAIARAKPLEVIVNDMHFFLNPIEWKNRGQSFKKVFHFKNNPMPMLRYYITLSGEISKVRQASGQGVLL